MTSLDLILPAPLAESSGLVTMDASEYHADPCEVPSLSKSIMQVMLERSPAHARVAHPRLNPNFQRVEKDIFDIGTVVHALLLEGEAGVSIVEKPDWKTNEAKAAKQAARDAGQVPLLAKDWDRCEQMVNAARRQLEMLDEPIPFTDGKPEQTLTWDDGDGVMCRIRLDWIRNDLTVVDDYKSTGRSAEPITWGRTMFGSGADLQVAFYKRGLRKALGIDPLWRFIAQETFPPYALSIVTPSDDVIEFANGKVDYAIGLWKQCIADNHWPAYTRELTVVELPAWKTADWNNAADDEDDDFDYGEDVPF